LKLTQQEEQFALENLCVKLLLATIVSFSLSQKKAHLKNFKKRKLLLFHQEFIQEKLLVLG
jgi:hypothetical protein